MAEGFGILKGPAGSHLKSLEQNVFKADSMTEESGCVRYAMLIVVGSGGDDLSSNLGQGCLHFPSC